MTRPEAERRVIEAIRKAVGNISTNDSGIIGYAEPLSRRLSSQLLDRIATEAACAALALPADDGWRRRYRHKKRGTVYTMIGLASVQADEPIGEGKSVVVYEGEDGRLWARPPDEFSDGRFEPIPSPPDDGGHNVG